MSNLGLGSVKKKVKKMKRKRRKQWLIDTGPKKSKKRKGKTRTARKKHPVAENPFRVRGLL